MRILTLLLLFTFSSCAEYTTNDLALESEPVYDMLREIPATQQPPRPEQVSKSQSVDKKVIYEGGIEFQSEDIAKDYQRIHELLAGYSAYIENENQNRSNYRLNYDLSIRVPAKHYDSLFSAFSGLGMALDRKYSNMEDVTKRYYDLESRIKNKKALEGRYLGLLKKASDIKDMLEIERSLNDLRTDIEILQGQFNYLSKQISMSTIHLNFYEVLPYENSANRKPSFFNRLLESLSNGWNIFQSFIIGFISLWPFLIMAVVFIILVKKLIIKRRKN